MPIYDGKYYMAFLKRTLFELKRSNDLEKLIEVYNENAKRFEFDQENKISNDKYPVPKSQNLSKEPVIQLG